MQIKTHWNPVIILMSISIAFIGSYGGITLYEQFRLCSKENKPKLLTPGSLLVLMAVSLGGVAIWCMHFVGMAAMELEHNGKRLHVYYRIDLTLISLLAVLVFCYIGLQISSHDKVFTKDKSDAIDKFIKDARSMSIQEIRQIKHVHVLLFKTLFQNMLPLVVGGVFTAAGVCVMHYIGMAAVVTDARIQWNMGIIAASVIIALVAATAAYWILFRLLSLFPFIEFLRVACAAIMAIAVNGMHYTGMAAAMYEYHEGNGDRNSNTAVVDQTTAVMGALAASMLFIWFVFILSIADLRVWYYNLARIVREADIRMTIHKSDANNAKQPFLLEYEELRNGDGTAHSILQFRLKMKQTSTSPHNTSLNNNNNSYSTSQVVPGDEDTLIDQRLQGLENEVEQNENGVKGVVSVTSYEKLETVTSESVHTTELFSKRDIESR